MPHFSILDKLHLSKWMTVLLVGLVVIGLSAGTTYGVIKLRHHNPAVNNVQEQNMQSLQARIDDCNKRLKNDKSTNKVQSETYCNSDGVYEYDGSQSSAQSPAPSARSNTTYNPTTSTHTQPALNNPINSTYKVDCSSYDSSLAAGYKTWAKGIFSDLATYEKAEIPLASGLGSTQILSDINTAIDKVDNESSQNYITYLNNDAQYQCNTTIAVTYRIPLCTDLNQCLLQIPVVP